MGTYLHSIQLFPSVHVFYLIDTTYMYSSLIWLTGQLAKHMQTHSLSDYFKIRDAALIVSLNFVCNTNVASLTCACNAYTSFGAESGTADLEN